MKDIQNHLTAILKLSSAEQELDGKKNEPPQKKKKAMKKPGKCLIPSWKKSQRKQQQIQLCKN